MKNPFAGAFLRTFSHATEDFERVSLAVTNIAGPVEIKVSRTAGVHGNPITILEADIKDARGIEEMIGKLTDTDILKILDTLPRRIDDGCNLFIRLDKQEAFEGRATLTQGEDVILIRLKVRAYPARCELAEKSSREYLEGELARRKGPSKDD